MMRFLKRVGPILALLVCLPASLAFAGAAPSQANPAAAALTISAAVSLKDALTELARQYERTHSGSKITLNFGASGILELQIERGAPADIFISASPREMNALSARGLLLPDTRTALLSNELVLIVPRGETGPSTFRGLLQPDIHVIAVGDPRIVPAGMYARQVLDSLGIDSEIKNKLVMAANVRQVLADVETASAQAGLVYKTDAALSSRVKIVAEAPPGSHEPILYPAAILRDTRDPQACRGFLAFLQSAAARAVFSRYGFLPTQHVSRPGS